MRVCIFSWDSIKINIGCIFSVLVKYLLPFSFGVFFHQAQKWRLGEVAASFTLVSTAKVFRFESHLADIRFVFFLSVFVLFFFLYFFSGLRFALTG